MLKKLWGALRNPVRIIQFCSRRGWLNWMSDEKYLKLIYKMKLGKTLDLEHPKTFNEKLQWLKLHDRNPEYTKMVDKYEVRAYVAEKLGEEYLIPLLGVWDKAEDIDYDSLPNEFVLKCTHDSGSVIVCRDKNSLDKKAAAKKLSRCLKNNGYGFGREWPYKNVKPRIIAEKYMVDESGHELKDYKFFAFDGAAKAMFIATDRMNTQEDTKFDFYDMEFKHLPFTNGHPNATVEIKRPENFEKMQELAQKLSEGIPHARVDFYDVNGQVYFGEITFFHYSGFVPFNPEEWDEKFGEWIKLRGGGYLIANNGYIVWVHEQVEPQETETVKGLTDYKFYCFNGEVKYLYVSQGLEEHSTACISFLTPEWEFAPFSRSDYKPFDTLPKKPAGFEEMKKIAAKLSRGHAFLRVDLYQIGDQVYFSELTFSPCAGFMPFNPEEWDRIFGDMIDLTQFSER